MTATRLQELYAEALARRSVAASECVTPDDLLALVRREGPEPHRLEVLDHVMGCSACRREFDLLRALEAAGSGSADHTRKSLGRRLAPLALAASLLLAVGVGLAVRDRAQPGDIPRGTKGLVLVAPLTEVAAGQPIRFVWHPVSGARRYRVEVLDKDDAAVFSRLTDDTTLVWSGQRLRPGSEYRWWVRDASPGAQLASPLRPLRVRLE